MIGSNLVKQLEQFDKKTIKFEHFFFSIEIRLI